MIEISAGLFYFLAGLILLAAIAVLVLPNPIHAALCLAISMISLGFMYFQLGAHFIAGVQLIVYAGAVMVLFVMVLMLVDLEKDEKSYSGGRLGIIIKGMCALIFAGLLAGAIKATISESKIKAEVLEADQVANIKILAGKLFTQYVFAFEALGILLLLIAIGVVAVSRTKGGTHARD